MTNDPLVGVPETVLWTCAINNRHIGAHYSIKWIRHHFNPSEKDLYEMLVPMDIAVSKGSVDNALLVVNTLGNQSWELVNVNKSDNYFYVTLSSMKDKNVTTTGAAKTISGAILIAGANYEVSDKL